MHLFNWGNYTSPDMIKKFEDKYNIKVTITDFDSNDTALAKLEAGGAGTGAGTELDIRCGLGES